MLKVLSRRWLGVSCWVYFLALLLAVMMYWLLPGSSAVHTWTFKGSVRYEGFTSDHERLVITHHRSDRTVFHQLHLASGKLSTYLPLEHPDHELDLGTTLKPAYSLSLTSYLIEKRPSEFVLQNNLDGSKRELTTSNENLDLHGGRAMGGG